MFAMTFGRMVTSNSIADAIDGEAQLRNLLKLQHEVIDMTAKGAHTTKNINGQDPRILKM